MSQTLQKCWTLVNGIPVSFRSMTQLADELDINYTSLVSAKKYAAEKGHTTAFQHAGRMIYLGDIPMDQALIAKATSARPAGGPLLRGHVTHRLGVYRGGQW